MMSIDSWSQLTVTAATLVLALATIALAIVTYSLWSSADADRRYLARPSLRVGVAKDRLDIDNQGTGTAYFVGGVAHVEVGGVHTWIKGTKPIVPAGALEPLGRAIAAADVPEDDRDLLPGNARVYCRDQFGQWYCFHPRGHDPDTSDEVNVPPNWLRKEFKLVEKTTGAIQRFAVGGARGVATLVVLIVIEGTTVVGVDELNGDPIGFSSPEAHFLLGSASVSNPCKPFFEGPLASDRSCRLEASYRNDAGSRYQRIAMMELTASTTDGQRESCQQEIPYRAPGDFGVLGCTVDIPVGKGISSSVSSRVVESP